MGKRVGAEYLENGTCRFRVWSPQNDKVELVLQKQKEAVSLEKDKFGFWEAEVQNISPGSLYKFRINKKETFPDPASRFQPEGVHSWSQTIDQNLFSWSDDEWNGRELKEMLIYELHTGTFTPQGSFEAIIEKLDHLEELGINTIELMPIAQFPGSRNWGYDGVYPYAVQNSYGGPEGLKKLIDACHNRGFSVLLDVVYNHLGPEGNYISQYGPYFTEKYHTPWGSAINYDDEYSDPVRNHFIQNALMWLRDYHFDGLRLDAIHEIIDRGARHFLKELSEEVDALEEETGRKYVLIAESDLNDSRLVKDYDIGGYGLEGQWVDDFHHSLHCVLTGENAGYFKDYGSLEQLAKSYKQAFVYDGVYSPFRKKSVGNSPQGLSASHFVTCIQNHDQVGNRVLGERLTQLLSFEQLKLAAGTLISAPFVPMLFMGEEYGEKKPFQYFVSHGDPDLVKAVQEGRKREFEYFNHVKGEFPDPQAEETFDNSSLSWDYQRNDEQNTLFKFYKELLRLRKSGAFYPFHSAEVKTSADEDKKLLQVSSEGEDSILFGIFNFKTESYHFRLSEGKAPEIIIASSDEKWGGKNNAKELIEGSTLLIPENSFLIFRM